MKLDLCPTCGGRGFIRIQTPRAVQMGPLCPACEGSGLDESGNGRDDSSDQD